MRRMMIMLGALALSACTAGTAPPLGIPAAPVQVADQTRLDEQTALAVELAYTGAATAATTARRARLISDAAWPCVQRLDRDAYAVVLGVRRAYDAGNATSYTQAAISARAAVAAFLTRKGC